MKKIFLSMFALFGFAVIATAQTVTVADVEAIPGQTVSAILELKAPADTYTGVQFALQFPATGFSVESVSGWSGLVKKGEMTAGKVNISAAGDNAFTDATIVVSFTVDGSLDLDEYGVTVSGQFEGPDDGFGNDIITPFSDVTFKVVVTDRLTLDENSTVAPSELSNVNVKVKRTIKAGEWSTICLPFELSQTDAKTIFGSDVMIKKFTSYEAEIDATTKITTAITLNFASHSKKLLAGTPYLIKTTKDIEDFDLDNVNIVDATSDVVVDIDNDDLELTGTFKGTLAKTTVPDKGLFISGNEFYYSTGKTNIKAFRGWFELDAVLNVAVGAPVFINIDGETTGIENIQRNAGDDRYYNLNGQHVENLKKGQIYIKNNKKVVVK